MKPIPSLRASLASEEGRANAHELISSAQAALWLALFLVALVGLAHGFGPDINEYVRSLRQ